MQYNSQVLVFITLLASWIVRQRCCGRTDGLMIRSDGRSVVRVVSKLGKFTLMVECLSYSGDLVVTLLAGRLGSR